MNIFLLLREMKRIVFSLYSIEDTLRKLNLVKSAVEIERSILVLKNEIKECMRQEEYNERRHSGPQF